jgi:hypothetical protein
MVHRICNPETSEAAAPRTIANLPGRLLGEHRGGCSYGTTGAWIGVVAWPCRGRTLVPG